MNVTTIAATMSGNTKQVPVRHLDLGLQQSVAAGGGTFSFSGVSPGDRIRMLRTTVGNGEGVPFDVAGTVSENEAERTLRLIDSNGAEVAAQVIPPGGDSFNFTGLQVAWQLRLD